MAIIVNNTKYADIKLNLEAKSEKVRKMIITQLCYIGEQAITYARNNHPGNWGDRTGHLRSSIGYMVLEDGKSIFESAQYQTQEGETAKRKLLTKLKGEYPQGLVLIVCAGMNYAYYVEAIYNKDVLTGANLLAKQLAQQLLSTMSR